MSDMQAGDVGVTITITIKDSVTLAAKNISNATVKKFYVKDLTGVTSEKTAIFTTDGSDCKLYYVTLATDFASAGTYRIQAYVELSTGVKLRSTVVEIEVGTNVPAVPT